MERMVNVPDQKIVYIFQIIIHLEPGFLRLSVNLPALKQVPGSNHGLAYKGDSSLGTLDGDQ